MTALRRALPGTSNIPCMVAYSYIVWYSSITAFLSHRTYQQYVGSQLTTRNAFVCRVRAPQRVSGAMWVYPRRGRNHVLYIHPHPFCAACLEQRGPCLDPNKTISNRRRFWCTSRAFLLERCECAATKAKTTRGLYSGGSSRWSSYGSFSLSYRYS